jgi:predicted transcriptional regulator
MATLLEMAKDIVANHAQATPLTTEAYLKEIERVYSSLKALENGGTVVDVVEPQPTVSVRQAFKTNEVICLICGRGGMKTLTRHLNQAHQMKPAAYRKQFGIKKSQLLMSKNYAKVRKEIAGTMDLAANLAKARAARRPAKEK